MIALPPQSRKLPLATHLAELKRRILFCLAFFLLTVGLCYGGTDWLLEFFLAPLRQASESDISLIYTSLPEGFSVRITLACQVAFLGSVPFFEWQLWKFIAPALYVRERVPIQVFLWSAPLLFVMGGLLAYGWVMPNAWRFFLSFVPTQGLPIYMVPKVAEYLKLSFQFIFAFGFCFQMPLLLIMLGQFKIIKSRHLVKGRRFVIVSIFIVAALLTPPDVLSQIALAIPLLILYEGSIRIIRVLEKKRDAS